MSFKININMPDFITMKREAFNCKCKNCSTSADGTEFPNFSELETHLKTQNMTFFNCPIYGCNHRLVAHSATITAHIISKHNKVTENLKLSKDNNNSAYYCNECNIYTDTVHFHCLECKASSKKLYFKSKEECSKHLKSCHNKWWLEHDCKRGTSCTGFKSGKCGFNHLKHLDKYLMQDTVDTKMCRYEKPWDNIRCNRVDCSYDHFWGRVRFILKLKSKTKTPEDSDNSGGGAEKRLNRDVDWEAMGVDPDEFDNMQKVKCESLEASFDSSANESSIRIIKKAPTSAFVSIVSSKNKLNEAFDNSDNESSVCSSISNSGSGSGSVSSSCSGSDNSSSS
jgi:hypothetical protein